MKDHDDTTVFQLPARPPVVFWLATLILAVYTGFTYAVDSQVWAIFRVIIPLFMMCGALRVGQILVGRWRERKRRRYFVSCGPDAERIP